MPEPSYDVEGFLRLLHPTGVYELRSPKCPEWKGGNKLSTATGWFNDHRKAAQVAGEIESLCPKAVYCTLNPCDPSLLGRANNRTKFGGTSTADENIIRRSGLLIDLDPNRLADTNSTDRQMRAAMALADRIEADLSAAGWPAGIKGMSGNGGTLIYRLDLPNDADTEKLIQDFLSALSDAYSTEIVGIDTGMFDAPRLCKVLGTMTRKGDNVVGVDGLEDMPQRRSYYFSPCGPLLPVPVELLQCWADKAKPTPATQAKSKTTAQARASDWLDNWLREHNVPVGRPFAIGSGRKWIFSELAPPCRNSPSQHECDGGQYIIEYTDGTIVSSCHHSRCGWKWQDLRVSYEPTAYAREEVPPGVDAYVEAEKRKSAEAQQVDSIEPEQPERAKQSEPDKSKQKRQDPPTTRAAKLAVDYLQRINAGELPQLLPQRAALSGIEIGPGLVTPIGAPPGFGKTALAMQVMFDALELDPELRAVVANAETSFDVLVRRELTRRTRIKSNDIRFGRLTPHDLERINAEIGELIPRLQRVDVLNDPCNLVQLLRLKDEQPGLVVVDYLQKFSPTDKDARQGVNEVMAGLRGLAKLGWSVLCLSATKRDVNGRHDSKELNLSSFRESGEVEYNADSAYVLRDNGPVGDKPYIRHVTLGHVKNRHGEKKNHELRFHMPRMEFTAMPDEAPLSSDFDDYSRDSLEEAEAF